MTTRYCTVLAVFLLAGCAGSGTTIINTFVNCPTGYAYAHRNGTSAVEGGMSDGHGAAAASSTVGCSATDGTPPDM